jgi:hypothetical protein
LKLKCDKPLSNVAFNFKLRRYTKAAGMAKMTRVRLAADRAMMGTEVRRCRLT